MISKPIQHLRSTVARLFAPVLLAVITFGSFGCSAGVGTVAGEVRFKGELLPNGRVTFICQGGNHPAMSADIIDGRYEIRDVPVGHVDVTVETFNLRSDPVPGGLPPPPVPKGYKYVRIPDRYGSAADSGLGFDVARGDQKHNLDLSP
ncbi:MAG TPA: hypothetical protein VHR66_21010 [Gemmataceae bacterium]|nr:hypothetical protein [Gemmataceae bacterium]